MPTLGNEDFWDDLLAHLKARVLVPVVGHETLVVPSGGGSLLLDAVIGRQLADRYELDLGPDGPRGLYDAVRAFIARQGSRDLERLYRVVNDILAGLQPPVPETLRSLARIDDLRLFISTTFDALLTRALSEARPGDPVREVAFSPNQSTAEQQANARPPGPGETVVVKLFGAASSTPQYAIHEEDVLEWLHALVSRTARLPEWLEPELKQRPLLFVGCRIPDWIGRFLVRMTSSTRLSLESKQFFIVGARVAEQPQLTEFFRTHCGGSRVQLLQADPAEFVAELHDRWRARTPAPVPGPAAPVGPRGTIFISYVREDADAARQLGDAIGQLGGDVWLDERRLQPGDRWEGEILGAIRRGIRLFVPVISRNTEAREEGYVFREWAEAVERARGIPSRRFIVPVVADPDYDGNPGRYRQVPEPFRELHFGHAPSGAPSPELVAALTGEIRAMRRQGAA
jgi:TIR domain/SIR2-like domain